MLVKFFKWIKRTLTPGARVVSEKEMMGTINEWQEKHGVYEKDMPEIFRDGVDPVTSEEEEETI
jgi:hypothetical protein